MPTQTNEFRLSDRTLNLFKGMAIVGVVTFVLGLLIAPHRTLSSFLLVNMGLLGMGLGAALFIALQYVCGAHWAVSLRRVPEAMCAVLPWASAGIMITLIAGRSLYPWTSEPVVGMKAFFLNYPFFLARAVAFLSIWLLLVRAIVRRSRLQDSSGDPALSASNKRLSAVFLVVFGLTFWMASFDWVMSLEPEWYSTMYGVYHFAGLFLGKRPPQPLLTGRLSWRAC